MDLGESDSLMAQSEDEVWLQSPYFIPSRQMRKDAERITGEDFGEFHENLEAKQYILTNSIENNPNFFGKIGYRYYRDRMIDVADEIYEYSGENSLHAKTFVIDRKVSMIGAFNYDPRSAYLSTESMIVIYSEGFAEELLNCSCLKDPALRSDCMLHRNLIIMLNLIY